MTSTVSGNTNLGHSSSRIPPLFRKLIISPANALCDTGFFVCFQNGRRSRGKSRSDTDLQRDLALIHVKPAKLSVPVFSSQVGFNVFWPHPEPHVVVDRIPEAGAPSSKEDIDQPEYKKSAGSLESERKPLEESDSDSMADYYETDPSKFNEDGSFIGQYGGKKSKGEQKAAEPDATSPSALSTFV